jgi:hypothetical protein
VLVLINLLYSKAPPLMHSTLNEDQETITLYKREEGSLA